jgi:hypothetical protein
LMSTRPWDQTIIFVAFAAEEQGTYGSRHFVQDMMLDGRTFDAAINNDIVGGRPGIARSIRVFSPGPSASESRQIARYLLLTAEMYTPAFGVEIIDGLDRQGRFSDHREFINTGVPAVRLTESEEDRSAQHGSADTADKIDYDYLRQVAQLNLAAVANMAGAPPAPQPPAVAALADPGTYSLTWLPDPRAAAYAISFRPLNTEQFPPLRYVSAADAGHVAYTDLDPQATYAVSLAAVDISGRIGRFSAETIANAAPG